MRVESIARAGEVLKLRCSGAVRVGSESTVSMRPVSESVSDWIAAHPDESVTVLCIDFTDVDYRWGDAPVSLLLPFIRGGIPRVHFVAGARSAPALESLLHAVNLPWFSVERADA